MSCGHVEDLEAALNQHGSKVAAFLIEPIQGEAGIIIPPSGYLKKCVELCQKHHVLLIADEIQCGLGRSGKLLASDYENVKADILVLGKALSGGLYPVSAVLASDEIMLCIKPGEHGSTYGGNPLGCAVAMEALKVLKEENLCDRSAELGQLLRDLLSKGLKNIKAVKEVRGRGLMNAIELDPSELPPAKTTYDLCLLLKDHGILSKPTHETILRLTPPLVIEKADIVRAAAIIIECIATFISN